MRSIAGRNFLSLCSSFLIHHRIFHLLPGHVSLFFVSLNKMGREWVACFIFSSGSRVFVLLFFFLLFSLWVWMGVEICGMQSVRTGDVKRQGVEGCSCILSSNQSEAFTETCVKIQSGYPYSRAGCSLVVLSRTLGAFL